MCGGTFVKIQSPSVKKQRKNLKRTTKEEPQLLLDKFFERKSISSSQIEERKAVDFKSKSTEIIKPLKEGSDRDRSKNKKKKVKKKPTKNEEKLKRNSKDLKMKPEVEYKRFKRG